MVKTIAGALQTLTGARTKGTARQRGQSGKAVGPSSRPPHNALHAGRAKHGQEAQPMAHAKEYWLIFHSALNGPHGPPP